MRISHHCCYVTVLQMTLSESDAFLHLRNQQKKQLKISKLLHLKKMLFEEAIRKSFSCFFPFHQITTTYFSDDIHLSVVVEEKGTYHK